MKTVVYVCVHIHMRICIPNPLTYTHSNTHSLSHTHINIRTHTRIDRFEYAYTLGAHEHVVNEDFDRALEGYRQAIAINPRHYNAW
jgi:hypothetical protein